MLADADEAQLARTALVAHGLALTTSRLCTGEQILATCEVYKGQRDLADKIVGAVADDKEGRELYLAHARADRCALWIRIPDESVVPEALRVLGDRDYLHVRYYRAEEQTDFTVS